MENYIQKLIQSIEKKNMNAKNLILKQKVNVFFVRKFEYVISHGLEQLSANNVKVLELRKKMKLIQFFDRMQHEL